MIATRCYQHESKEGVLNVDLHINMTSSRPAGEYESEEEAIAPPISIKLAFECASTGALYYAAISYATICHICPLFHAIDEVVDTLGDAPIITIDSVEVVAHWIARGRTRAYPVYIIIKRREYPEAQRPIVELKAENSVLRKKVAALELTMNQLVETVEKLVLISQPIPTAVKVSKHQG